ncbi:MAG: hypothetical protein LH478_10810 [Chitinophagaceae bacterium]|nr:hypothetical protein [Chitinophagaceae bacterium]
MLRNNLNDFPKKMEQYHDDLKAVGQLSHDLEKLLQAYHTKQKSLVKSIAAAEKSLDDVLISKHINTLTLREATLQMEEMQMSFNLQYLQLQSQMQHENRAYTAVSNIMKTKHDTVKNSIGNVK